MGGFLFNCLTLLQESINLICFGFGKETPLHVEGHLDLGGPFIVLLCVRFLRTHMHEDMISCAGRLHLKVIGRRHLNESSIIIFN